MQEANAHIPKSGFGSTRDPVRWHFKNICAEIVASLLARGQPGGKSFNLGLTVRDRYRGVRRRCRCDQQTSSYLASEVEQERGRIGVGALRGVSICNRKRRSWILAGERCQVSEARSTGKDVRKRGGWQRERPQPSRHSHVAGPTVHAGVGRPLQKISI